MTTGATGGTTTKRKTDGEEARGGERGMHARAKWDVDMELGQGDLGGGERGGTTAINGTRVNSSNYRPESSVQVSSARGCNNTTL